jgi:hypothetical protein
MMKKIKKTGEVMKRQIIPFDDCNQRKPILLIVLLWTSGNDFAIKCKNTIKIEIEKHQLFLTGVYM